MGNGAGGSVVVACLNGRLRARTLWALRRWGFRTAEASTWPGLLAAARTAGAPPAGVVVDAGFLEDALGFAAPPDGWPAPPLLVLEAGEKLRGWPGSCGVWAAVAVRRLEEAAPAILEAAALGLRLEDPEAPAAAELFNLDPRELQYLDLLARGLSSRAVAERLGLRPQTVKNRKLRVKTRTEAVAVYLQLHHLAPEGEPDSGRPRSPSTYGPRTGGGGHGGG